MRDVRDAVFAGEVFRFAETLVEHAVESLGLFSVARSFSDFGKKRSVRSARRTRIAPDSKIVVSSSTSAGIFPFGLTFKKSGLF